MISALERNVTRVALSNTGGGEISDFHTCICCRTEQLILMTVEFGLRLPVLSPTSKIITSPVFSPGANPTERWLLAPGRLRLQAAAVYSCLFQKWTSGARSPRPAQAYKVR